MSSKLPAISRGTTYVIDGVYTVDDVAQDITGAAIFFTMKSEEWDEDADDSDAVIKSSGSIVSAAAGTYRIVLSATDTYKTPGDYFYDIKIKLSNGYIYKLAEGEVTLDGSPTNRTS